MKTILLLSLFAINSMAMDMSKNETYKNAYKDLPDGSAQYVGKCSTHQDYNDVHFKIVSTMVKTFEPKYEDRINDTRKHLKNTDPNLIKSAEKLLGFESISDVDDLTIEKIESKTFQKLNLIRMNIGVGGGNGIFAVFNKISKNNKITYELMSSIMDGDVEYCDSKVWLK